MVPANHVSLAIILEIVNVLYVHQFVGFVRVLLYVLNVLLVTTWRELIV